MRRQPTRRQSKLRRARTVVETANPIGPKIRSRRPAQRPLALPVGPLAREVRDAWATQSPLPELLKRAGRHLPRARPYAWRMASSRSLHAVRTWSPCGPRAEKFLRANYRKSID